MLLNKIRKKMAMKNDRKGFSLVEVLIAVSILAIIAVPMAMNMISSSQINGQSKQISSSSDISTSVLDVLQTVPLSDVMTEMNGYVTDEYGAELPYLLTANALQKYTIGDTMEVIKRERPDGTYWYEPVVTQENAPDDAGVTASVKTRTTGEVVRTYFSGTDNDEYAFVLKDVENDQMHLDVLTTIKPIKPDNDEQSFDMVNINSMTQSEVKFASQQAGANEVVANEFLRSNQKYINKMLAIGDTAETKLYDWFLDNMERTITIKIVQDASFDAATITIDAVYTVNPRSANGKLFMHESDATYIENIDSFSTNSTSEFARGIYLYFYPLVENFETGEIRDHFVIENNQNLAVPVFLIAKSDDKTVDPTDIPNHRLSIEVRESATGAGEMRTTVCSNIPDPETNSRWRKNNPNLKIKTMGNRTGQQIIYQATVQVFTHRENLYDATNGYFTPNEKYLLVENVGSFLDTSEKLDIESDKTTIERPDDGRAKVTVQPTHIYNGNPYTGVVGNNVTITGNVQTNAGKYIAYATPLEGFVWEDGSNGERVIEWEILRAPAATIVTVDRTYDGTVQNGIFSRSDDTIIKVTGQTTGKNVGRYIIRIVPTDNYCWPDGDTEAEKTEIREFEWKITPRPVNVIWATGENKDWWKYDGDVHHGSAKFNEANGGQSGVIPGDSCDPILRNHDIRDVGEKMAEVYDLTNKNYKLPEVKEQLLHKIQVLDNDTAGYGLVNGGKLDYNTQIQDVIEFQQGVWFEGPTKAKDSGTYDIIVHVKDGYAWPDGSTEPKEDQWFIYPHKTDVQWGVHEWVYDGITHSTTCVPTDILENDSCVVGLDENNWILDVGTRTTKIISLSNPNYELSDSAITEMELKVTASSLSHYSTLDVVYDGRQHKGVFGQYIIIEELVNDEWKDVTASYTKVAVNMNTETRELIPYEVRVSPHPNYTWADGSTDKITVSWYIYPVPSAEYECRDMTYTGKEQQGVFYKNATHTGAIKGTEIDTYNATVTPKANLAWYVNGLDKDYESCNFTSRTDHMNNGNTPTGCMHDLIIYDMKTKNLSWNIIGGIVPIPAFDNYDPTTGHIELEYNSKYIGPVRKGHSANDRYATTANSSSNSQEIDADYYRLSGDIRKRDVTGRNGDSVGYYTMRATLKDPTHFTWADGTKGDKVYTWRIHPFRVGVGAKHGGHHEVFTYNAKNQEATMDILNVFPDDVGKVNFTYSGNINKHAGTYQYYITGLTGPQIKNYSINKTYFKRALTKDEKTCNMVINQLAVQIGWSPTSGYSGTTTYEWTYDSRAKTAKPNVLNAQGSDQPKLHYEYKEVKHVADGTKTITVTDVTNGSYRDYKLDQNTQRKIKINPREVKLSWGTTTFTFDGTTKTVTCKVDNPQGSDRVTPHLSGHQKIPAGSYTATVTSLTSSSGHHSDYALPSNPSTGWKINPKTITPIWTTATSFVYSGRTYSVNVVGWRGLVSGYPAGNPKYTGTTSAVNANDYSATCNGCTSSNYVVSAVKCNWEINRASINPPTKKDRTWNGSTQNGHNGIPGGTKVNGTPSAKDIGSYSFSVTPDSNHCWSGGQIGTKYYNWKMKAKGTASYSYTRMYAWNGDPIGVKWSGTGCSIGGTTIATRPGTFYIYFKTKPGYVWSDGSQGSTGNLHWWITDAGTNDRP